MECLRRLYGETTESPRCVSHVDRSTWETHRSIAGPTPYAHRPSYPECSGSSPPPKMHKGNSPEAPRWPPIAVKGVRTPLAASGPAQDPRSCVFLRCYYGIATVLLRLRKGGNSSSSPSPTVMKLDIATLCGFIASAALAFPTSPACLSQLPRLPDHGCRRR
jgi:hypothetical protein